MNLALNESWVEEEESARALEKHSEKGELYALVDPFFELPESARSRRLETRDTDPAFFEAIAWDQVTYVPPRLALIDPASLRFVRFALAFERWGTFVVSHAPFEELARHFQKFVIARGPDQNPYFLRFHDPAVLKTLLETWAEKQAQVFFGPVERFGVPDLDSLQTTFIENPAAGKLRSLPRPEDCLLSLGRSQLQACGEAIDRDLVKIIGWHLRSHHARSVQYLTKPVLEERVRLAIDRARRYSLGAIADLAGYAALMFELAPNFDEHPSFKKVLDDQGILPETKMKRLAQAISDREWDEARSNFDRSFWLSGRAPDGKPLTASAKAAKKNLAKAADARTSKASQKKTGK